MTGGAPPVQDGRRRAVEVLSTMRFDEEWLRDVADGDDRLRVTQHPADRVEDLPPAALARAEVLYTGSCLPTREQAPALRLLQLDTSGADHVVGSALWARPEVTIASIGGISPRPMAGYVMAMLLAFAHHLPDVLEHQRRREWPSPTERWERFMPAKLDGTTLVVVGYGRLGRAIGDAAAAFGIRTVGVRRGGARPGERLGDARPPAEAEVVGVERLHEALGRADHVVIATPLTPETRGLVDAAALRALKPGAILVNVSRGGVVDEDALLDALADGRVAAVAADVFAEEPLPASSPFWSHPRSIVTPHVAGFAPDYRENVRDLFRENLSRYLAGREPLNAIDRQLGY